MRRSGCGRPSAARIGRLSHGPVSTAGGQVPSFSPPSTSRSARCRRASSGPQMASRGWRPKVGRTISGSSMAASSAGHSPPSIASLPVQAARRRASASASASPASPDHSASGEAIRLGRGDGGVEQRVRARRLPPSARQDPRSRHRAGRSGPARRCRSAGSPNLASSILARNAARPARPASGRAGTCGRAGARRRAAPRGRRPGCTADASAARAGRPARSRRRPRPPGRAAAWPAACRRAACRPNRRCRCSSAAARRRRGGQGRGRA